MISPAKRTGSEDGRDWHPPAAVFRLDWWLVSMRPSFTVPCALERVRSWTNARDFSPASWTSKHWRHQVPPPYRCLGHNDLSIQFFCEELSLHPRTRCSRRGDVDMRSFVLASAYTPAVP